MINKYFKYLPSFGSYRKIIRKQTEEIDFILNTFIPDNQFTLDDIESIKRNTSNILEIGCGNGDTAINYTLVHSDCFYIASDVYLDGIINTSKKIISAELNNIKFWQKDARLLMENINHSLDYIFLFFPDPWPKNKHHKKRIINIEFLELAKKALKPSGRIIAATDHPSYRDHINKISSLQNLFTVKQIDAPEWWVETNFQSKAIKEGRDIYFFEFTNL